MARHVAFPAVAHEIRSKASDYSWLAPFILSVHSECPQSDITGVEIHAHDNDVVQIDADTSEFEVCLAAYTEDGQTVCREAMVTVTRAPETPTGARIGALSLITREDLEHLLDFEFDPFAVFPNAA